MPRFFCREIDGSSALITGEDASHIARSLRMAPGEELTLCDGEGNDYRCRIDSADPCSISLTVLEKYLSVGEPSAAMRLFMALPKSDKLDLVVQKSVELGVSEIIPVLTSRCISRPKPQDFQKKRERLNKIALEAAKQCGRGRLPEVRELLTLEQAFHEMSRSRTRLLLYERATTPLTRLLRDRRLDQVDLLVGCEGGFSPEEVSQAVDAGLLTASLGSRVLRCETAPLCALSVILCICGDL